MQLMLVVFAKWALGVWTVVNQTAPVTAWAAVFAKLVMLKLAHPTHANVSLTLAGMVVNISVFLRLLLMELLLVLQPNALKLKSECCCTSVLPIQLHSTTKLMFTFRILLVPTLVRVMVSASASLLKMVLFAVVASVSRDLLGVIALANVHYIAVVVAVVLALILCWLLVIARMVTRVQDVLILSVLLIARVVVSARITSASVKLLSPGLLVHWTAHAAAMVSSVTASATATLALVALTAVKH